MNPDRDHLRLLTIFHTIAGVLTLAPAFASLIHLGLGMAFLNGWLPGDDGAAPPLFIGWLFIAIGGLILVTFTTVAILLFMTARALAQTRSYNFCLVVACLECLLMPYGTVLGVVTIFVLMRPSVKTLFGIGPPEATVLEANSPIDHK
jgi:hypothetical protein